MEVIEDWERPNSVNKTEKRLEIDKLRNALQSIAGEIQKFQESSVKEEPSAVVSNICYEKEKELADLLDCKLKIKTKRGRIKKLTKNLKTACFVIKTVTSAKEDQSKSLKQHLSYAQTECFDLLERYKSNTQIINGISTENQILHNKLNNVENFIHLGYTELQKIRHESAEETSVLAQLKQLIVCCGEYYANSCNEHEVCLQLKHKNNFLLNKIQILENNVSDLSEQLRTLKYRNGKLQKEIDLVKDRCTRSKTVSTGVECSEGKTKSAESSGDTTKITYKTEFSNQWDFECDFDLLPHLSLVKKMLSDQDALLKDLTVISQEFRSSSSHDQSPF